MNNKNRRDFLKLSTAAALTTAGLGEVERALAASQWAAVRTAAMPENTNMQDRNDQADSSPLMAGVAQVDITPPPGVLQWGFLERVKNHAVATGTLDPLYARVLVLAVGESRLGLVTLDLGRTFGEPLLNQLRQDVRQSDGISYLVVAASHTHSGPNILDSYPPGQTPAWETAMIHKIEIAINKACQKLAPARMGTAYGSCFISSNRIRVNSDGSVKMFWQNPTKVPTAPVDPTVGVIRVDSMDGSPLAILVNYACHSTILGPTNLKYSADWPGVMVKTVEQAFDGKPQCMFLQGACGDINPYYGGTTLETYLNWTGETLGNEVIRVARDIKTQTPSTPALQFSEDVLQVKLRWDPAEFRDALLKRFGPNHHTDLMVKQPPSYLETPVTTFMINKEIAFAGVPGEPFTDFQIDFRNRCPARYPFFMGYTNGHFDYIPTIEAASRGGYGAGDSHTRVAVGTGERFVLHSVIRTYGMLDKWNDLPEDLKRPSAS